MIDIALRADVNKILYNSLLTMVKQNIRIYKFSRYAANDSLFINLILSLIWLSGVSNHEKV